MDSYQNGGIRKIEEIGVSAETLQQRRSCRRLLFTSLGVVFLLVFLVMAKVVHGHQKQRSGNGFLYYDDDDGVPTRDNDSQLLTMQDLNVRTDTSIPSGCESTVIILRHCEKDGPETWDEEGNEHCSYVGYERAHFIPSLFATPVTNINKDKWPVPAALFALSSQRSDHLNFREVETLTPLANHFGLQVESDIGSNNHMVKTIFHGLSSGKWCGKSVVISWKHELFGTLAEDLGCYDCPLTYPDQEFDQVWQLKYVYDVAGTPIIQSSRMHPTTPTPPLSQSTPNNDNLRRDLKRKKLDTDAPTKMWSVYSTIVQQNFDPLKYSFAVGDYDGGSQGGKWFQPSDEEM